MIRVSFVISAYKRRFLRDAIASILAQTYRDFELVVVDDGSPEDLKSVADGFSDGRMRYYRNETNLGGRNLTAAWNRALGFARGEWVVMASDDDVYEPQYAERMLALAEKYPQVDVLHCRIAFIDAQGRRGRLGEPRKEYESPAEMLYNSGVRRLSQRMGDLMIRRSAVVANGGYVWSPKAWFTDHESAIWFSRERGAACAPEVLFGWRESGENISMRLDDVRVKLKAHEIHRRWIRKCVDAVRAETESDRELVGKVRSQADAAIDGVTEWVLGRLPFKEWAWAMAGGNIPWHIRRRQLGLKAAAVKRRWRAWQGKRPYHSIRAFAEACREVGGRVSERLFVEKGFSAPVLVFCNEFRLSGAPMVMLELARELRRSGWQPIVCTYLEKEGPLGEMCEAEGFPALTIPILEAPRIVVNASRIFAYAVVGTVDTVEVAAALNGLRIPVLWWLHEGDASYNSHTLPRMPKTLSANVKVFCCSVYAMEILRRHAPQYEARILYPRAPGGDCRDSRLPGDAPAAVGRMKFVCAGTVESRKGQDILMQAVRQLTPEDRRRMELMVVGKVNDAGIMATIEAAAEEFPDVVRFMPAMPRDEIQRIYGEMDALVCPSRADPMPLVVQEALRCGRSVICSENTGWRPIEQLQNDIWWCRAGDVESLADALRSVLNASPEELERRRRHGQEVDRELFSEAAFHRAVTEALELCKVPFGKVAAGGVSVNGGVR